MQYTLAPDKAALAALANCSFELRDVLALLTYYDDATAADPAARRDSSREAMKRAGIIIAVTAWETLIEDLFTAQLELRLTNAATPTEIKGTFNYVAQAWLSSTTPKPPDLEQWTGDGWKRLILARFQHDIAKLNTPNSAKIRDLSTRYLGQDITLTWKWGRVSSGIACTKLDQLIGLRGNLAHRGKDHLFESTARVLRGQVVEAVNLVWHLAKCTSKPFNIELPKVLHPKF